MLSRNAHVPVGLLKISGGNYGGRLGKSFIYLRGEESRLLQEA